MSTLRDYCYATSADLAKEKGFKWSPYKGLVNRDTNELVSNDLDNIAKQLKEILEQQKERRNKDVK